MSGRNGPSFARRVIVSFAITAVLFVLIYLAIFLVPDPARFFHNWTANTGTLLFFTAAMFVVFGGPAWGVILAIYAASDAYKARHHARDRRPEPQEHIEGDDPGHGRRGASHGP